jgi:large subunit ribosomal protein L9
MEVILLEKMRNLGALGDKVNVKPGYGRNYLIPQGKAIAATKENIAVFEKRRQELEEKAHKAYEHAQQRAQSIADVEVTIAMRASGEGKLYGSVGTREIAQAVTEQGVTLQKSEVLLPKGAFHYTGEYEVELHLHSDVLTNINVKINAAE